MHVSRVRILSAKEHMRIRGLDFLRGVSILIVLIRHAEMPSPLYRFGWLGVELFFVMSGFLVSGLLFSEYKKRGKADIKRFLIRRGLKIYPAFYFFILVSLVSRFFFAHEFYTAHQILSELFYLQSYIPGMWAHTWTLAVEEHFYLLLSLGAFLSFKKLLISRQRTVIGFLLASLVAVLLLRIQISYPHRHEAFFPFIATHLRMDGILIGVLCSYCYHFTDFYEWFLRCKKPLVLTAIPLLAPGFIFNGGSFIMNTVGLSLADIGFVILLLALMETDRLETPLLNPAFRIVCFVGIHSYSIYLWHLFAKRLIEVAGATGTQLFMAGYIALALILGIACSYAVERPFLRLRELYTGRRKEDSPIIDAE